jgi:predicted enzyme related to lactoylglutathione lyase
MQGVNAWICTVSVENVDEATAKAVALGGVICLVKMAVPGVGWLAYAKDTEGNIFGMMQHDTNAR